jgi:hypothetical protein
MNRLPGSLLLGAAALAVVAAVVTGLFVLGSPMEERERQLDNRRVADLQAIMAATNLYWTRYSRVPATLDELIAEPGVQLRTADPASSEVYGYQSMDGIRYQVCASFDLASEEISRDPTRDLWAHGAGSQCFSLEPEDITDHERKLSLYASRCLGVDFGERWQVRQY